MSFRKSQVANETNVMPL